MAAHRSPQCHLYLSVMNPLSFQKRNIWSWLLIVPLLFLHSLSVILFKKIGLLLPSFPTVLSQVEPLLQVPLYGALSLVLLYTWTKNDQERGDAPHGVFSGQLPSDSVNVQQSGNWDDAGAKEGQPLLAPYNESSTAAEDNNYHNFQEVALWKYASIGGLFALYLTTLRLGASGHAVPGPVLVMLQQMVVPLSMALAVVVTSVRFSLLQYLGAIIVLAGVALSLEQEFQHKDIGSVPLCCLIFVANLPLAINVLWIERLLKAGKLHFIYGWQWIRLFQFLISFALSTMELVAFKDRSFSSIFQQYKNGVTCLFSGVDVTGTHVEVVNHCGDAVWWWVSFVVLQFAANLTMYALVKLGSATLAWLVLSASVPLETIGFSLSMLMGSQATTLTWFQVVASCVVVVGLLLYRSASSLSKYCRWCGTYEDTQC